MKIGILTYHNAYNYGAVLQCFALQEYLSALGNEVSVIDYRNTWVEGIYKPFSFNILKCYIQNPRTFLKYLLGYFKRKKEYQKKKQIYSDFLLNYLNIKTEANSLDCFETYDIIFIGSDQLWGLSCLGGKFDEIYLGNFDSKNVKLVGYAISADLKSLKALNESNRLISSLKNFTFFSLREKNNAKYVSDIAKKDIDVCVDPTLLLSYEGWNRITNTKWKNKNYVVVYQVRFTEKQKSYLIEMAKDATRLFGEDCCVIDLSDGYEVSDFVSIIKYAKLVITSSFHATVFSLIFKTKFYSIELGDGNDARYASLLHDLNLDERLIKVGDKLQDVNLPLPSYSLDVISCKSVEFIKASLR